MEICLPAEALAEKDENGQSVAPGPGDTVNFRVDGKVTRASNGYIYVTPAKVNDQEINGAAGPSRAADCQPSRDDLLAELQQADGNMS